MFWVSEYLRNLRYVVYLVGKWQSQENLYHMLTAKIKTCKSPIQDILSKTTSSNDHFIEQHFRRMNISYNNTLVENHFIEMAFRRRDISSNFI